MELNEPKNPVENLPENPKNQIIYLDAETTDKFFSPISKKWYFVEPRINELTTHRTQILERRLIELGFSVDFGYLVEKLSHSLGLMNKSKTMDAYTTISNLLLGLKDLESKTSVSLWVCSVFIYEEGENPWEYSDELTIRKIDAWKCFGTGFFLTLAVSSLASYRIDLDELFPEYSEGREPETIKQQRVAALKALFGKKPDSN